ncbi:SDR family NAD(P)-dependent oxidoreductase [Pseudonocardia abyssalis]|jgi:NAD(P)-dependent dehydrogenase (short-subunit alcohol dehydrogenase family)|uniref:SDR family oxidoreductase n=1 Tax=Pseudonocardia abyssalis TaxID=2792008 RepID=A0ABS6USJ7_9PSEU|nr:SDR family oxidoreductase [Pseudonocardia abyssalis]MBW0113760.1 SDR family oxidoreductase [Pseudonocardia abyssalis]MBW0134833.1 SDR family oxidoreductase [Pseudonocardia abyssalis]
MRTTLVTGGASGIGRAVVDALRADGHDVLVADLAERPEHERPEAYVRVDLGTADGIDTLVAFLDGREVHDLVHCAAVGQWSSFRDTPRPVWERILRTNLDGTIGVAQAVVPLMPDGGRIVLFASGTVFKGPKNLFAYVASKAGVIGFARCLADELGDQQITVNVVSPGITATPMITDMAHTEEANIAGRAIKRRALPEDLVGPVRFLLSAGAAFVTGQTLCADGGSVKH